MCDVKFVMSSVRCQCQISGGVGVGGRQGMGIGKCLEIASVNRYIR